MGLDRISIKKAKEKISRMKRGLDHEEHGWLQDDALNQLQRSEEQQENAWLPCTERNGKRQATTRKAMTAMGRAERQTPNN